ncbi:hypothetical protein [Chryseosolibacter indicus]|uniref:Peptidase C-terminal archaeal/bacterial domain-containing protein n=1 Tax=Chryseosolibacter indicus TaxID=2782351 RepID=A0ABS5VPL2_9BACT|nr:hypothetical protein [Chryseosolibacter indicus]MBT1702794.1 hypothetical protein [Chryseosolibacter indicus]
MKKLIFIVLSVFVFSTLEVIGQCNADALSSECIPKLAEGFNFLKSYKIEKGGKDYVEYSYVFTKGTQYMINICAAGQNTDGIVVSLYDSNRNKVATSKVGGQFISAIAYPCNTTGIYYIQYTFDGSTNYCGGSALGFKR